MDAKKLKALQQVFDQNWNSSWKPVYTRDLLLDRDYDFFKMIRTRVQRYNESFDLTIVGSRGLGKSANGLAIALLFDPTFSIDRVCFSVEEWIELTNSLVDGGVVILDEVGTEGSLSSRTSISKGNRTTSDIIQLCRTDRIITIYISVDDMRIDKRVRSLSTLLSTPLEKLDDEMTRGNGLAGEVDIKYRQSRPALEGNQKQQQDGNSGYLVHETKNIRYASKGVIESIIVPHPPISLWKKYEIKRNQKLQTFKDTGFIYQKTTNIDGMARKLKEDYDKKRKKSTKTT